MKGSLIMELEKVLKESKDATQLLSNVKKLKSLGNTTIKYKGREIIIELLIEMIKSIKKVDITYQQLCDELTILFS